MKIKSLTIALIAASFVFSGCSLSFNTSTNSTANSNQSAAPKASATASPTVTASTAASPASTANESNKSSDAAVKRTDVKFAKGETGTEFNVSIAPGETQIYVVNVKEGQYLGVQTYADDDVSFTVRKKGGEGLEVPEDSVKWGGDVPESGDYEIVVKGLKETVKYKISINAE